MIKIVNPKVKYTENRMIAEYIYSNTTVRKNDNIIEVCEKSEEMVIETQLRPVRTGVMLVGWGGNNGSTFTAAALANRLGLSWPHKSGTRTANWYGSITQASTVRLGADSEGRDVFVGMNQLLPMVDPNDLVIGGWDISGANLAEATSRAEVLDYELQMRLRKELAPLVPLPGIYDPDFIAANQADRATNIIPGTRSEQYSRLRKDIKDFRVSHNLELVIVLWTANTERFCELMPGIHDTAVNLRKALANNDKEVSPSTIYAMAAVDEKCCYINGSPQNTLVPGLLEMAEDAGVFVGGDDFKSGQTKLKSVLVDFLVNAGIKPVSIVSYNHLGNNDGKNLSSPKQFKSKEITKSNVVDDMVESNHLLYGEREKPDHCVVIKYVPYVGDSKRAMDEYTSEILLGGHNTIAVHNTCEDSLLAVPIILDLVLLTELFSRVRFQSRSSPAAPPSLFHTVLSPLSYLLKAPMVPPGAPVVNALFKQRACIENILRACLGLAPESHLQLEHKIPFLMKRRAESTNGDYYIPSKKIKY